jgi:hypothetical protein
MKELCLTRARVDGDEHPSTLTSMHSLASIYMGQDRWEKAKELVVRVIELSLRVLGGNHLNTLVSMHNLAATFMNLERWVEAEELEMRDGDEFTSTRR